MIKRLIYIVLFIVYFSSNIYSQSNNWILGYDYNVNNTVRFGKCILNFNEKEVTVNPFSQNKLPRMGFVNSSISDKSGNFLLTTDGFSIYDNSMMPIKGGEVINPGEVREKYKSHFFCPANYNHTLLPFPNIESNYVLIHIPIEYSTDKSRGTYCPRLCMTTIKFDSLSKNYYCPSPNDIILEKDIVKSHLAVTRHANGRDWWIIIEEYNTNVHFIFLLDPLGIVLHNTEEIGEIATKKPWSGNSIFTPDGTKFIKFSIDKQVEIFNFDRCSGELSEFTSIINQHSFDNELEGTVAVSANSKFLYLNGSSYIWQYDLEANDISSSIDTVGIWDSFYLDSLLTTSFYHMVLADDNKIYVSCHSGNIYLHTINDPNAKGKNCDFTLRNVELPYYMLGSLPIFPNYKLGADNNSNCDSISVNIVKDTKHNNFNIFCSNNILQLNNIEAINNSRIILNIFTVQKQLVLSEEISNKTSFNIDLSYLAEGIYLVNVINMKIKTEQNQKISIIH